MAGILGEVVAKAANQKASTWAATLGVVFLAWCLYFDRRRRADPNFKKRLRDRRLKARRCTRKAPPIAPIRLPDMRDNAAVLKFFLQEILKGEELLGKGDEAGGVEHMAYAVAFCGQPNKLLQVLNATLTPHVFGLLLDRLPSLSEEINENPTGAIQRDSSIL